jgi:hypothetical protein
MCLRIYAIVYNFIGFAPLYFITYYLVKTYAGMEGFWIPLSAAFVSIILAPKFQTVQTSSGEKMFMKWILKKGVKEVK